MKQKAAILIAFAVLLSVPAYTQSAQTDKGAAGTAQTDAKDRESGAAAAQLSARDRNFLIQAAQGGMAEVELGRLAAEKGSSDEVKKFGQRMVDDHGKANERLKKLAADKGVDLPADMGAKHKAHIDRLSKLSGDQFDRAYIRHMMADHRRDVSQFKRAAGQARDQDIKAFAAETLPTLQEHLSMSQQHHATLRGKGAQTGEAAREKEQNRQTEKQ